MMNILKSILTSIADASKTSSPSRDRRQQASYVGGLGYGSPPRPACPLTSTGLDNARRQRGQAEALQVPLAKQAVPREFALASGDNSRAADSHFYDVSSPDGHATTFLIGEVAASGARAVALINLIQSTVRSADQETAALQINRVLYEQDRYAAMFWSQFDPETRLLHFINAGHLPPLLFKANRRPMQRLDHAGPGLGVFPNATYRQGSVSLDPGDILVIYSDGIVEASDHSDENFGEDRLITVVELSRNKSVEEIRNRILSSVGVFTRDPGPATDRTLLVIRYAPISYNAVTRLSTRYRDSDSTRPIHLGNF